MENFTTPTKSKQEDQRKKEGETPPLLFYT
nr:MAG TPA: hypothetical protein [Caudoviricetes sp.]